VPLAACPRAIATPDSAFPDELRELIDTETRSAFERGRQAGLEEGAAAARGADEGLPDALRRAFADGAATLAEERRRDAAEILQLAVEIARLATNRDPGDDARGLLERIRGALAELDDSPITVGVHPSQASELADALDADAVEIVPDGSLAPGEAVLRGPWSSADLRWEARWRAVRSALGLGDGPPGV
jgi:flagellar biosynthesis/type III secretory pathway protein FliH